MKTSCEIMVQKILPAIRVALTRSLINEYGCNQQKASEILGLSRAAVSQYMSEKRGAEVGFSIETQEEITKFASKLMEGISEQEKVIGMCHVCKFVQKSGWLYKKGVIGRETCMICGNND
ncbi:transcriptional regulator [Methanosalsum natronophilum]|uniref:Transcriptional regulator n=1 Tax=Methanosalsum natronophilum TaxID=768733 RepID=A0A3R7X761_9EURY|nr:transcriptional regulator [Methanosalsum natronophilum]MCS3923486.1 putative transcriptional regulator [Methanosalsum natronophilum]RQD86544.1 MAG: transcriptional regulator [Methanosalsum natronophilum]